MNWFALEVNAIDPFISSLPIEQQNELKNRLSQRLFGQSRSSNEGINDENNNDLIKVIGEQFTSVVQASR